MKKIFMFNGCSQTAGKEVVDGIWDLPEEVTRNHTWAKHFQMLMNPEGDFVNIARSGCSNESIFRTTVDWLAANQDALQDVYVAVMWTEPNRFEFEALNGFPMDVISVGSVFKNAEEKYLNKFSNEYLANKKLTNVKTLNLMLALESILISNGIPFIFLNGFNNHHFYSFDDRINSSYIKLSKYKSKVGYMNGAYGLDEVLSAGGFTRTKHWHYLEDAHKYYANYIFEKLGEEHEESN